MQPLAFLPAVSESVMDELRTTEGMLFRDEGAKKLFLDVKALVMESLGSAQATFTGELYETVLDRYVAWDAAVATEELQRADAHFRDIGQRLTPVTVLYAKYLYAGAAPLRIRKPRVDALLRGMFTRLARLRHVRTGTFFELNPLQQDFVLRDMFRQTLATDCITIVPRPAAASAGTEASPPQEDVDDADTAIVTPAPVQAPEATGSAPVALARADALPAQQHGDQSAAADRHPTANTATPSGAAAVAPAADGTSDAAGEPLEQQREPLRRSASAAPSVVVGEAPASRSASVVHAPTARSVVAASATAAAAAATAVRAVGASASEHRPGSVAAPSTIVDTTRDEAASQAFARAVQDDDVYPDDSISRVLDRALPTASAAPDRQRGGSVASHASVRSRVSQFHMPKDVRRVLITDNASEVRTHVEP